MFYINELKFYQMPCMCGDCPAFCNGSTFRCPSTSKGLCNLFDLQKGYYDNMPKRCRVLFEKAFTFPDGSKLVIVPKNE